MAKRNAENNYNTNLASEYFVMSILHRIGVNAFLSLGNKKGVDILIRTKNESICILEVKGVNKKSDDWIIGNSGILPTSANLFYALISFNSEITNVLSPVEFYIISSELLKQESEHSINRNGKTVFLRHKYIRENYGNYFNTLKSLLNYLESN